MKPTLQLSDSEIKMIEEISKIFEKYKSDTRQFGLQLVHSHFPISENEILYETHSKEKRTLSVRPLPFDQFENNPPLATAWQINKNGEIEVTMFCCDGDGDNGGTNIDHPHIK